MVVEQDPTLASIALQINEEDALNCIEPELRCSIEAISQDSSSAQFLKDLAVDSLNQTNFSLQLDNVSLTGNGSVIFELTRDQRMLQMRLDLIVAGQGISKWPKLSAMDYGWSTVAYTTKLIDEEEKKKIDEALTRWVEENGEILKDLSIDFNSGTLGCLVVRCNDFYSIKWIDLPIIAEKSSPLLSSDGLRMSPRAGREGPSPIAGNRAPPVYEQEDWLGPIHQEIVGEGSYARNS